MHGGDLPGEDGAVDHRDRRAGTALLAVPRADDPNTRAKAT